MVILLNEQTMPRMTVTGERIVSPITDPINRVVALINGCESDGTDAQDNRPPRQVTWCQHDLCHERAAAGDFVCAKHRAELDAYKHSLAVIAQREQMANAHKAKRVEWTEELDEVAA